MFSPSYLMPNYDYWFMSAIIPLTITLYIFKTRRLSLIFENTVLAILSGVLPFLFIYSKLIEALSLAAGSARQALHDHELANLLWLFFLTQLVTLLNILVGLFLKIKKANKDTT